MRNLLLLAAACILPVCWATYYPDVVYLDDYCSITYVVNNDLRIKLSWQQYLQGNKQCTMNLRPKSGSRLVAAFRYYSIHPAYVSDRGDCQTESIQLMSGGTSFFGNKGYCGSTRPTAQFDLGPVGSFSYRTWPFSYIIPFSVDLLISEVTDKGPQGCPANFFNCNNNKNYCISDELTCNGYDDCGNNRDEIEGCGLTVAVIGAIVAVVVFVFLACVASAVFIMCRRRRQRITYIQYS